MSHATEHNRTTLGYAPVGFEEVFSADWSSRVYAAVLATIEGPD